MEMQKLLAEINALAKKKKEEGLNEAEQKRQKEQLDKLREQARKRLTQVANALEKLDD